VIFPTSDAFDGNLVFDVFDYDLFGSNDFLGRAVVSVLSLKPGEVEDQWITLQPRKGKKDEVKGEIHLKLLMTV
jgi:Ca2+-dependent lipid-binding protein